MADALDLQGRWLSTIRAYIGDIATLERTHSKRSKRDKAVSRWVIYLGVMLIKAAEGVRDLAPTGNVRAMTVLMRSVFEYEQKAEYFLTHRDKAYEQYKSIGARQFHTLSKMARINPNTGPELAAQYLAWKRTSGNLDEWSGNVAFTKMHLANAKPSQIKTASDGKTQYTEELTTAYGVPSLYAHGESLLIPEVFRQVKDDSNWDVSEDFTYFDPLTVVNGVNAYLSNFCVKIANGYKLGVDRLLPLRPQIRRVLNGVAEVHRR